MAYAYRDKYGILHVTKDREEAERFAVSQVVEYIGEYSGGYLVIGGQKIFDYGDGIVYVGGNEKSGAPLDKCEVTLQEIVKKELSKIGI